MSEPADRPDYSRRVVRGNFGAKASNDEVGRSSSLAESMYRMRRAAGGKLDNGDRATDRTEHAPDGGLEQSQALSSGSSIHPAEDMPYTLHDGSADANSEPMAEHGGPTREEIEARLEAVEARSDARFSEMLRQFEAQLGSVKDALSNQIDAKFTASDVKLTAVERDLAVTSTRIGSIEARVAGIKATVVTTGIAIVALTVAVMAYGGQWFGLGMDANGVAQQAAERALQEARKEPGLITNGSAAAISAEATQPVD